MVCRPSVLEAEIMKPPSFWSILSVYAGLAALTEAMPTKRDIPVVTLDDGTFIGVAAGNVNEWLGIPFAKPPCSPFTSSV